MKRVIFLATFAFAAATSAYAQAPRPTGNVTIDCQQEIAYCNINGNESVLRECLERRTRNLSPVCLTSMQKMGWKPQR